MEELAVVEQVQGLQAEGGEGRVAAAQADHDELAHGRGNEQAAVGAGEREEQADHERARDVDDQRAPREGLADQPCGDAGAPVAEHAPQGAADPDPEIGHSCPLCRPGPRPPAAAQGPRRSEPRFAPPLAWRRRSLYLRSHGSGIEREDREGSPMNAPVETITVARDEGGLRLDRWFRVHFPDVGYTYLQKLLRSGQVRVDSKRAQANTRLEAGQQVRVP